MRPRVPWMNEVDDLILEFFEELGEVGGAKVSMAPGNVHYHVAERLGQTEKSRSTFSRRMKNLANNGLLRVVDEDKSLYEITDMGHAYLAGDLDADDLQDG